MKKCPLMSLNWFLPQKNEKKNFGHPKFLGSGDCMEIGYIEWIVSDKL